MSDLFLRIVNMSISASWLVLTVLLLRFVFKKVPKWVNVLLWGIVAVRLIFPFSIESAMSLIPSAETIPLDIGMDTTPAINSGITAFNSVVNPIIGQSNTPVAGASVNPLQITIGIYEAIWKLGVAALLTYTAVSYLRLRRKVSEATLLCNNIYQCENVGSPFVLGIIRPKIYLPYHMSPLDLDHVVAHEEAHIRRKDHWWKPLGFLLLTIHWFNPLMWLAYVLLCRDIELACDEKVIKELGNEQRADYTQALVACSVNRRMIAACPIAFGEVGVKERVKSVMNYKKPAFRIIVLAVIVCVAVAVCFLTNPTTSVDERLAVFIDCEIASQHQTEYSKDNFCCLDWEVIGKETSGNLTTVYMWVLYEEYSNVDGLTVETGSHLLTAITVKEDDGNYSLVEYWIPEDGSYYSNSIREKVPMYLWGKAFDSQRYIGKQSEKLEKLAKEHFEITTSNIGDADSPKNVSVVKWFDYLETPNEMQWDGRLEFNLPEFPDMTFRWYPEKMEAVVGNDIIPLYTGMPIWNAYFCDLTGDGLPELCSTLSIGSGVIDSRVIIYDYANGVSYSLEDRMNFDYTLRLNSSDGHLYVDKTSYFGGGLVSSGRLVFRDNCLQIEEVLSGDPELGRFYLTIGAEGITHIEVALPHSSGGVQNADGSPFKMGERIWLEPLDGVSDLRGLRISAMNAAGEIVWQASIPDGDENRGFTHLSQDGWVITDLTPGTESFVTPENITKDLSGVLHLGLNAEIIDIDHNQNILYVKDIDKSAAVFGDKCAIDCSYAISRFNLLYVNYSDANIVRTIEFSNFKIGDTIIIGMYDSEKQNAFNGSAIAEQIQLSTQRLSSTITPIEYSVQEIGRGILKSAVELSDVDAASLLSLIKSGNWVESVDIPVCDNDCAVNLGGKLLYYCSECGTFTEYNLSEMTTTSHQTPAEARYWSMTLPEQVLVNNILCKYIDLMYGVTDVPGPN